MPPPSVHSWQRTASVASFSQKPCLLCKRAVYLRAVCLIYIEREREKKTLTHKVMQAYSTLHEWDHALFGRVSTVLQQADVSGFELRTIATIVQAYCHKEVCVCVCVGAAPQLLPKPQPVLH